MIDVHCHVLGGIDDGPETDAESIALARAAVAAGTGTALATPHVNRRYPNDAATIARRVAELDRRLVEENVALRVLAGAELALTRVAELDDAELARLGLGGGPWLLVEPPFTPVATNLDSLLLDLKRRGHRILLAHPERCAALRHNPKMLASLVDAGVLTSVTAASLTGRFGEAARRFALALAQEGLLHNVASDAHDHVERPPSIAPELRAAGLEPLGEWLTETVPAAILAGEQTMPPRPAVALRPRRPRRRLLRR